LVRGKRQGRNGPEEEGRWGTGGLTPGLYVELVAMLDVQWSSSQEGDEEEEEEEEEGK